MTYAEYNQFDILYFYCPLCKSDLEMELEKKIATDAKPGAIVLANLPYYFKDPKYSKVEIPGWKLLGDGGRALVYQKLQPETNKA